MSAWATGVIVDDRYTLIALLGAGTFGQVWSASDAKMDARVVAIKVLRPEFLTSAEVVLRFENEARALAKLQHPNVIALLDRGDWNGRRYIVFEFVDGRPLDEWLESHRTSGRFPALGLVRTVIDQTCAGVAAGHEVRMPGPIVHRDLKPGNVMFRERASGECFIKVVDFGIAQLGGRTGTQTGASMGTLQYMSPEQALGHAAAIGPSTDVFALGVLLVEMLTLRASFDDVRPWWSIMLEREGEVRAMLETMRPGVPGALWDAVAIALRRDPKQRPASASMYRAHLAHAWEAILAASGGTLEDNIAGGGRISTGGYDPNSADISMAPTMAPGSSPSGRRSHPLAQVEPPATDQPTPFPSARPSQEISVAYPAQSLPNITISPQNTRGIAWAVFGSVFAILVFATIGSLLYKQASRRSLAPQDPQREAIATTPTAPRCPADMIAIASGQFMMGAPDTLGDSHEHPQHLVDLSRYCIDRTEVTVAAYSECVAAHGCEPAPIEETAADLTPTSRAFYSQYCNGARPERLNHPINCVTWEIARTYCAWKHRRLPTEAEWEYATRGIAWRTWAWGNEQPSAELGNLCAAECQLEIRDRTPEMWPRSPLIYNDGYVGTAPVGTYPRAVSAFGLLDMSGNVSEWVSDSYGDYESAHVSNPTGPSESPLRVLRGGSWIGTGESARSTRRVGAPADFVDGAVGFRCASPQ